MSPSALDLNTIDLSSFLSGKGTPKDDAATASLLVDAYKKHGFAYCIGWEGVIPADLVAEAFKYNELLFALPQEKKDLLAYTTPEANRGYLRFGRENGATDKKETFEIGNGVTPEFPEHWPSDEDVPGFKATMSKFHLLAHELNVKIMQLLAMSLDLDPQFFHSKINGRHNNLRLLHYPPVSRDGTSSRVLPHTDDGTITLLWQDFTGGLEVMSPSGEWVAVVPKAGTLLVNVGDILERWSNDLLKSTRHRAVLPEQGDTDPTAAAKTRRSIAYFGNPDRDAIISCIPGLGEPKYPPVVAKEFYAAALAYGIESQ